MNVDYIKYALFEYESITSPKDEFRLGDVVKKKETGEIEVIIQIHDQHEYRTDMWGNCSDSEIELATLTQIVMNRPSLFD